MILDMILDKLSGVFYRFFSVSNHQNVIERIRADELASQDNQKFNLKYEFDFIEVVLFDLVLLIFALFK